MIPDHQTGDGGKKAAGEREQHPDGQKQFFRHRSDLPRRNPKDGAPGVGAPPFPGAVTTADGVIREAVEDAYWGGMMVLDFDGWSAVLRCVTPRAEAGTKVAAGEFIASVAPAPAEAAQEPHFHLEVEVEGQSLDPAFYF